MRASDLTVRYGEKVAIKDVNIEVHTNQVLALIGPSGCGKSTFLRSLNRMNDTVPGVSDHGARRARRRGHLRPRGRPGPRAPARRHGVPAVEPVPEVDLRERRLRPAHRRACASAALSPSASSARCATRRSGTRSRTASQESGLGLSGGQQQRLCIARALAVEPEVLLMDEPASALDPIATAKIEDLVSELRSELTIVIVTHNMQQAARVSQRTGFFYMGRLVEVGDTTQIFTRPKQRETEDYITGRFG